jgi:glycosyltransferase involved in cell wall biosynthesis
MGDDLLGTPDAAGRIKPFSRWMVAANRRLAGMVDAVIVKSAEMAEVVAPVKPYVIPNGVDLQTFQPLDKAKTRAALGWDEHKRYILFPGNPANPRKGFQLAQAATERASTQMGEALEVVTLWKVAPEQVPLYMNGCDAMVMASLIEGSPNVVKEAMACNLPVVSVPVGDVPELLKDVQGYAVCPREAEPLAAALTNILLTKPRAAGRAALERKGLTLETVAQKIMNIYKAVLNQPASQSYKIA